jgi:hypothetical protein
VPLIRHADITRRADLEVQLVVGTEREEFPVGRSGAFPADVPGKKRLLDSSLDQRVFIGRRIDEGESKAKGEAEQP